jgi:hypothetical protein
MKTGDSVVYQFEMELFYEGYFNTLPKGEYYAVVLHVFDK